MAEMTENRFSRRLILISLLVAVLFPSPALASTPHVLNSEDWKDSISASTFFEGEKFLVRNPGEAEQAVADYNRSAKVVVSRSNPGFNGLTSRLGANREMFSYRDVYTNSSGLDKLYIVNPAFASETLTVLPQALKKNTALTFYSKNGVEKLDRSVETVYVGQYKDKPWINRENSEYLNYNTPEEFNRENIKKNYNGGSVILTDPGSPGFQSLLSGDQILLKGGAQKDAELLEDLGITILKVIGSENTGYARQLDSLTSQDLRIAAKVGRAVADPENAELYDVKSLEMKTREAALSVESAVYDTSDGLIVIELVNEEEELEAVFENMELFEGESSRSYSLNHGLYLEPGEKKSLVLKAGEGLVPTQVKLEGSLNSESWSNSTDVETRGQNTEIPEISREGDVLILESSAERVYAFEGNSTWDLEKLNSHSFRVPDNINESPGLTVLTDGNIYVEEIPEKSYSNFYIYFAVLLALIMTIFFMYIGYREFISDR